MVATACGGGSSGSESSSGGASSTVQSADTSSSSAPAESSSESSPAATESAASDGASSSAAAPAVSLHDQLPERIQKSGKIIVANPLSNPPYAFLDTDGTTIHGLAPDLSKALEPLLGVTFDWVNTPFPGLIPGLQSSKFDMIWGSITDTKEREKTLDFVDYEKDGAMLLTLAKSAGQITDITSLCGKVASTLSGSVQVQLLKDQSTKCTSSGQGAIQVKEYGSVSDAELAVRSGKVSAFFAGMGAALYQVATAKDDSGNPVYATAGPIYEAQIYGAAFRKDDTQLRDAIQAGIKQLIDNGTYAKIFDEYGMGKAVVTADEVTINGGIT
jgi:polar amino acid transport system substrate-binding protein